MTTLDSVLVLGIVCYRITAHSRDTHLDVILILLLLSKDGGRDIVGSLVQICSLYFSQAVSSDCVHVDTYNVCFVRTRREVWWVVLMQKSRGNLFPVLAVRFVLHVS